MHLFLYLKSQSLWKVLKTILKRNFSENLINGSKLYVYMFVLLNLVYVCVLLYNASENTLC